MKNLLGSSSTNDNLNNNGIKSIKISANANNNLRNRNNLIYPIRTRESKEKERNTRNNKFSQGQKKSNSSVSENF